MLFVLVSFSSSWVCSCYFLWWLFCEEAGVAAVASDLLAVSWRTRISFLLLVIQLVSDPFFPVHMTSMICQVMAAASSSTRLWHGGVSVFIFGGAAWCEVQDFLPQDFLVFSSLAGCMEDPAKLARIRGAEAMEDHQNHDERAVSRDERRDGCGR